MATIAGKVQGLSGGKFFVKDEQGNIKELSLGDNIYENSSVYGDSSNSSSAKVEILLSDNDVVVLNQGQQQLIDASLIETAFGTEELFFTREGLDQTIAQHNSIADVDSDLREANFKDAKDKSITEEETTEGEEEVEDEEGESGQFASRDGSLTDVESGLIKKPWPITRTFNEAEKYQNLENLYKKELGANPSNPFEPSNPGNARPTTPTRPSTDKPSNTGRPESEGPRPLEETPEKPTTSVTPPPAVTPPIIPAKLTIFDYETVEHDGVIYLVVKIDKPAEGDIEFTYIFKDGSAKEGEDFIPIENTAIIKSGETEVKIPVKIINDNIYEGTEEFKVVITETKGNVEIEKGEGTVTITDRNDIPTVTIPKDPNPTDEIPKDPITGKDNPPEKPYNPGTGIIPQDPTDLPKDPITNKPLIPGNFEGNEANQDTKDVRVPEGNDAVFKTTLSNPSAKDEIVKITITNQTIEDNDIERPNVKFYDKNGNTLEHTNNPDGSYNVKLPAGETEFYTVVPTVQDATYENEETFGITADINNTTSSATGTITDKNDIPTLTIPKDPNPLDPTNPDKPEEPYNPETGIIPQDPTDLPKDPTTNKPLIPGFFDGNEVNQDTKDVRVPEGNDAVFKTTLSNPSSKDEIVKITITTTPNEEGKASDSDIERDDVKFYDKNGKELSSTKNQDGSYDVKLPAGETTFYTVVPTAQDSIYEVDETFGIKADINNTSSSATGTITDKNDIPTVTHPDDSSKEHPKDPNPLDPENPNKPNNYNPETGITPLDPNDSKVPPFKDKDGDTYTPKTSENEADQTTKDVKVPEGDDAVFKTTLSNPSYKDEVVKVTITTTPNEVGKANEYDISRDNIKFFDENGKELEVTKNEDGSYNVPVEKGQTTFYTVVPTEDNVIYEGDEVFEITAEINNTISKATGTIYDGADEPKVGIPVDSEDSEGAISISPDIKYEKEFLEHTITLTNKSELTTELTIELRDGTAKIGTDTEEIQIVVGSETITLTLGEDGNYTSSNTDVVTVTSDANGNNPEIKVIVPALTDEIQVRVEAVDEQDDTYEGEEKYTIAVKTEFDEDYTTATGTIIDDTEFPTIDNISSDTKVESQGTDPSDITSLVHNVQLTGMFSSSHDVIIKLTPNTGLNLDGDNADIDLSQIKVTDKDGNILTGLTIEATGTTGEFKVTLPANTLEFQVHIPTKPDNSFEPNETYKIEATVAGTTTTKDATGTITDVVPKVSIDFVSNGKEYDSSDSSQEEKPAEFKITLDKVSTEAITVSLSKIHTDTTDADFGTGYKYFAINSDGTKGAEIVGQTGSTITIPAGSVGVYVEVPIFDDKIVEGDEKFNLKIDVATGSNATVNPTKAQAEATIIDNDSPQIESIKNPNDASTSDVKVYEGDDLVFKVKITIPSTKDEEFVFTITDGTTSGAVGGDGADTSHDYNNTPTFSNGVTYDSSTGKIKVPAGVTEFEVFIKSIINNDSPDAANSEENFTITVGDKTATGTIVEGPSQIKSVDDNGADGSVTPAQAMEGEYLLHKVTLTGAIGDTQDLVITLADGTATIGEDTGAVRYSIDDGATWNTVTLDANGKFTLTKDEIGANTTILVAVEALIDDIEEDDEIYTITASMVSDSGITSSKTATGKILDYTEATPPKINTIAPNDVIVDEGQEARFTVKLDKPSSKDETFEFSINDGTATGGDDYEDDPTKLIFTNGVTYDPTTEKITVPAGVTEFEVIVPTNRDTEDGEPDEIFTITVGGETATGTIKDVVPEEGKTPIVITEVGGGKPKDPSDEENPNKVEEDRDSETGKLNPAIAEEGDYLIHTIKLSGQGGENSKVKITFEDGTAKMDEDISDGTGTDTRKIEYSTDGGENWSVLDSSGEVDVNGKDTIFVRVPALTDDKVEGDEVYYITATMTDNGVTSSKTSTGTILDKNVPTLEFDNPTDSSDPSKTTGTTPEGEEIIYKVKIPSGPHDVPLEYIFTIDRKEDNGIPAEYDENEKDYNAVPEFTNGVTYDPETGKIKIPAGVSDFEIIIKTNEDDETDDNEEFEFKITKVGEDEPILTGTGLITEKDIPTKVVSITPDTQNEGEVLTHTVTIKKPAENPVNVVIDLDLEGSNPKSADIEDIGTEEDKTITIAMKIGEDDKIVTLTYGDNGWEVTQPEDGELPFAVVVNDDGKFVVTVPENVTTFKVKVPALADNETEGNESYNITASIYEGGSIVSTHTATGTIIDVVEEGEETPVENEKPLTISNTIVPEGTEARFKVTITPMKDDDEKDVPSTFDFSIGKTEDTATAGTDYQNDPTKFSFTNGVTYDSDSGKITVPAGVTTFEVIVPTKEDETPEPHETFTVTVGGATGTGTITDKTPIDTPQVLKITDDATMEGGINTHTITVSEATKVTVNLKDDTATISYTNSDIKAVKYSTDGGKTWTIVESSEWESFDVTLTEDDKTIKVEVETLKDSIWEGSETYKITASTKDSADNITSQKTATGTIVDANPVIDSIKGDTKYEGEELVFDVKLSYETVQETTYEFTIKDGTAIADPNGENNDRLNGDYNTGEDIKFTNKVEFAKNEDGSTDYTKIVVPAGVTEFQVIVETNIDNIVDNNEQMTIEVGSKEATGTILDKTKIPGIIGGPGNGNDNGEEDEDGTKIPMIQGDSGDDVIVADFGGLKTTLEPGTNYNMAFILDVSGSMKWNLDNGANGGEESRLELLKAGMMQYIKDTVIPFAKEKDTGSGGKINLAFITFSASSSLKLSMKDLQEENWDAIESAIKNLTASGNTNWESSFITTKNWFKGLDTTDNDGNAIKEEGYENITFFITDGDPTAKVSSGSNNTLGYITAAKTEFDDGLGKISDVHAIGVGNMVNKTWLSLFDNTADELVEVTIDTISPTKENIGILNTNTNWTKDSDDTNPSSTGSGTSGRIQFIDAGGDDKATIYTSKEFTGKENSYVTFNYYKDNWEKDDSFTWYLEKKVGNEWEVVDVGANAAQKDTSSSSSNTNTGQKTFQTGILDDGATYRFVFDVKDNTSDGKYYSAMVGNFQYNTSSGTGTFEGMAGKPDVIMTAEQLQYALQAGGLYAQLQTVGNDIVHGGDGNDIIFGDAINTDWLEWTDRNHGSASQPDADGSGMAALKYYLGLGTSKQMSGAYELVDSDKGVQVIDIYNFIKANESKFNLDGDERGGNDILDGGAGEDIIYGQGGNDTITTDLHTDGDTIKGDILIDGGTGYDTLILEGNYDIDFSILDSGKSASDRIKNIEEIDLTKGDHQLLNLKLSDVLAMTDSNKELIIKGDGADKVTFAENDNWTRSDTAVDGYYEYTNSSDTSVKVKVQEDINNQII